MRVKHLANKNAIAKTSATKWVRSTITKKEVEKARADGLIPPRTPSSFPAPNGSRSPLAVIG
jgi:hypothetical protein